MAADLDFVHAWEPGPGRRTLLLLHGTGGDEHDLMPLGRQLASDANLLSPRGPVSENGMPRFFRRLAPGRLDIPDLHARTDDLAAFIGRAAEDHGFDPARITALGFSNGANIATSLLFRHPGVLAGAALLRPMLPYAPPDDLDLSGRRVLIEAGGRDPMVKPGEPEQLAEAFRTAGAEVDFRLEPEAGHSLTQGDLEAAQAWLEEKP